MTSIFGTDSGFSSISNNHLYLYLASDRGGKVGDTNIDYCSFFQQGIRDDGMILGKEYDNDLMKKQYIDDVSKFENQCSQNLQLSKPVKPVSSRRVSIYSIMNEMPYISEAKKLVDSSNYSVLLDSCFYGSNDSYSPTSIGIYKNGSSVKDVASCGKSMTFFAFDNDSVEIVNQWLNGYKDQRYDIQYYVLEFLKANTLPFGLNPSSLVGKKIRLTTNSPSNYIYVDGRGKELVVYMLNNELNNFTYPAQSVVIKVKGWIQTENGWLYVLEAPILPRILI